jgi:hypothetical protein
LASLSSKESLTVPSRVVVAQVGETATDAEKLAVPESAATGGQTFLGLPLAAGALAGIATGLAAVGLGTYAAVQLTGEGRATLCPIKP